MEICFLFFGIILFVGLFFGKIARLVRLPNVTGYLIGGVVLIVAFKLLGVYDIFEQNSEIINLIPSIALAFIAFSIGTEFKFSYFKMVGIKPIVIAICEAIGASLIVFLGLFTVYLINPDIISLPVVLMLSAIASATAPAATIMVIKQYKAKGEVTKNLLSVVAIDDAIALILFGIMFAVASSISNTTTSVAWNIAKPIIEIVASLGVGILFGIVVTSLTKLFTGRGNRLCVVFASLLIICSLEVLLPDYLEIDLSLSTLLACMMVGAVFTNTNEDKKVNLIMELVDRFTPPLLIMFFVISGADLDFSQLATVGIVGIVYIVCRMIGKVAGASGGAIATKSSPAVRKYLGYALIPQAGVAIGLSLVAVKSLGSDDPTANIIRTVVLSATLVYELIGPFITKIALKKAGEITA